jgi:hypothetical protein
MRGRLSWGWRPTQLAEKNGGEWKRNWGVVGLDIWDPWSNIDTCVLLGRVPAEKGQAHNNYFAPTYDRSVVGAMVGRGRQTSLR